MEIENRALNINAFQESLSYTKSTNSGNIISDPIAINKIPNTFSINLKLSIKKLLAFFNN